jgi:guanylate kinase
MLLDLDVAGAGKSANTWRRCPSTTHAPRLCRYFSTIRLRSSVARTVGQRGTDSEDVFESASQRTKEKAQAGDYMYQVVNDDLDNRVQRCATSSTSSAQI